jgi:riboflavin synthase
MFTGLIQDLGSINSIERGSESAIFTINTSLSPSIHEGDSISVNGVCLTATSVASDSFTADVMVQTLKLTSLKSIQEESPVNLELATTMGTRLGGHMVQGHVDGVGKVISTEPTEKWWKFIVEVPKHLLRYIVNQGSIAIDGVSLTVGELDDASQSVTLWLIPETLTRTNLSAKKASDEVNIEVDVIAKYVERLIDRKGAE